jgi:hypothetical protein
MPRPPRGKRIGSDDHEFAVVSKNSNGPDETSAIACRRQLRALADGPSEKQRQRETNETGASIEPNNAATERAAASLRRLLASRRRSGHSLGR